MKIFYTSGLRPTYQIIPGPDVGHPIRGIDNLTAAEPLADGDEIRVSWMSVADVVPGLTDPMDSQYVGVVSKVGDGTDLEAMLRPGAAYLIVSLYDDERERFEMTAPARCVTAQQRNGISRALYIVSAGFAFRDAKGNYHRWDGETWQSGDIPAFARLKAIEKFRRLSHPQVVADY